MRARRHARLAAQATVLHTRPRVAVLCAGTDCRRCGWRVPRTSTDLLCRRDDRHERRGRTVPRLVHDVQRRPHRLGTERAAHRIRGTPELFAVSLAAAVPQPCVDGGVDDVAGQRRVRGCRRAGIVLPDRAAIAPSPTAHRASARRTPRVRRHTYCSAKRHRDYGAGGIVDDATARAAIDRLRFPARPLSDSYARPIDWPRLLRTVLMVGLALYAAGFIARAYLRNYFVFLPGYARWMFTGTPSPFQSRPTHVFVLIGDHFEPEWDPDRVQEWATRYVALASRHHDSTGRPPQHGWFYPGEQYTPPIFEILQRMTR